MSGVTRPQRVTTDPTPEAIRPLQRRVASLLEQVFSGPGTDNPLFEQSLNLPTFGSEASGRFEGLPLAAGPNRAQLDALSGFQQAFDPSRIVDNRQTGRTLQQLLSDSAVPEGGTDFQQTVGGFNLGSQADPFF